MRPTCRGIAGRVVGNGLTPTGASFIDSLYNVPTTASGVAVFRPNCMGVLRLAVGRGCTQIVVFMANNDFGITTTDGAVTMYVDGAPLQSFSPTSQGLAGFVFLLDGQPHTVEVYSPYQQYDATTVGNIIGGFIYRVQCYGGPVRILGRPATAKQLVVYGDSIASTALAAPDAQNGWIPLLRRSGFAGRISLESWGGRALWDDSGAVGGYGFPSLAALATQLVGLGFGAPTLEVWDAMGFNDWGLSHWSDTSYGAACATLYDAIHAAAPAAQVFAQTILITGSEGAGNAFGKTPADYRAAKAAAAVGRSWVTVVSGPTLMAAGNLSGDGVHPTTAGHAQLATNIGPLL